MAGERAYTALGDLIEVKHGWPFKSALCFEELTGRPIVINIGNFRYTGGFRFGSTTVREYRGDYPHDYELSPGEILLVMTCQTAGGEILGIPARVPDDGRTYLHNQRLGRVVVRDPGRVDQDYLYWLFLSPSFNRELYLSASGTKILHTAPTRIEAVRVSLPCLGEQRAIAHILGTLDDKIELNRRVSQTLEAMARALFKSWFVDFDPVRAKAEGRDPGLPRHLADLIPSSFEDSQLGPIPAGWGTGSILERATLLSGGTPKTDRASYWGGDIPWVSAKDVSQCGEVFLTGAERTITTLGVEESATQVMPPLSTVVVARGATTGRMALLGREMAMNQTCYALVSTTGTPFALHCQLRQGIHELVHAGHGSVFNTITTSTFNSGRFVLPPGSLHAELERLVSPLFGRILAASEEARALASVRDTLLPRLISGEVRVEQAEHAIGIV
ncbi:MAG: restriction endonuclease subunit S [Actinomycetota bacterium]|nr:restriction endonuclease subunit S [Actinomycetota bacterium]